MASLRRRLGGSGSDEGPMISEAESKKRVSSHAPIVLCALLLPIARRPLFALVLATATAATRLSRVRG